MSPAETKEVQRATPGSWWALFVLFLLYVISFADRQMLTIFVDPIQRDLGISDFAMGIILGPAFAAATLLFGLPVGWLLDRMSRRTVIFYGVAIWSLATATCGFATSAATLFTSRIFVGAGETVLGPGGISLLADKFPRRRLTLAISIFQGGLKAGTSAAYAAAALITGLVGTTHVMLPLIGEVAEWQLVFLIIAVPGPILGLLLFTFSEPAARTKATRDAAPKDQLTAFLKQHSALLVLLYVGFGLVSLAAASLIAWVPAFMGRAYGWGPAQFGWPLSIISIATAFALAGKGYLVDWLYARGGKDAHIRFYSWILIASIPIVGAAFFMTSGWVFIGLYGIIQVITIPSMIYLTASLAIFAPREIRGRLTALAYFMYTGLGLGIGPAAVGALTDLVFRNPQKLGWSLTVVLLVAVCGAAVCLRLSLKPLRAAIEQAEVGAGVLAPAN